MQKKVVDQLLSLNQRFYQQFAEPFAESRSNPQPGFNQLLEFIPRPCRRILDVGCGEGRFGRFLFEREAIEQYTGVDFSHNLIDIAKHDFEGEFVLRDLSRSGCLESLGSFDAIACLATMQHIPGREQRRRLLKEMAQHLGEEGRILISNWQFPKSERQMKKVVSWSKVGLDEDQIEPNDFLLTWQRGGTGLRYVSFIGPEEMDRLAESAGLNLIEQFEADGREGNLNHYSVLSAS